MTMDMSASCETCGAKDFFSKKYTCEHGSVVMLGCDKCLGIQPRIYDVYFRQPYQSTSLGVEFTSKKQKATYLAEHGLSEAGDQKLGEKSWVEGSREYRKRNFEKARPLIRENYRKYLDNVRKRNG